MWSLIVVFSSFEICEIVGGADVFEVGRAAVLIAESFEVSRWR